VLVDQWKSLGSELPEGWSSAELTLRLADRSTAETAARLLGPAQPYRVEVTVLGFRVARDGSAPSPDGIQRLLRRLDQQRVTGTLTVASTTADRTVQKRPPASLVESWVAELAWLPADWSDLFAEIELTSSDYLEQASLLCVPLNARRDGKRAALRFRAASRFGYGASAPMVRRCLERCDRELIRGEVRVLQVLSDTKPVATQGPVWLLSGKTV
jgi:hypothetical protein